MSKNEMKRDLNGILNDDVPGALWPALKALALAGEELWHEDNGEFLSEAEREARGKAPLLSAGDMTIRVEYQGVTFVLSQAHSDKPSVVIPVGMSDKITTAAQDHGFNYRFLLACLERESSLIVKHLNIKDTTGIDRVQKYIDILNGCIDNAMVETDGRFRIDKSLLGNVKNEELLTPMVSSLTRKVKSRSKGTTRTNMTVSVEGLPPAPVVTSPEVGDILDTTPEPSEPPNIPVAPVITTDEGETEGGEGLGGDPSLSDLMAQRKQITEAIGEVLAPGDLTIGAVKKAFTAMGVEEAVWRPRFVSLQGTGHIVTNGASGRSCRYSWDGDE